jgi:protein involved in polysaccharide export with SLBB domain
MILSQAIFIPEFGEAMTDKFIYREKSCWRYFLYGLLIIIAMATAGVCQNPGVMASEGHGAATGSYIPKNPRVSNPTMDLPLSTWVGPGDALRIKAYPDTASFISGTYTIFDSGFVMLPIFGFVQITKMSISGLTKQLTDEYAKYMAYPSVQIEPMIRILLLGGFLRPGTYLVNPLHPFSNALSAAGGTVRDDGLKLLRWERNGKVLSTNLTSEVESNGSLWALGFKSNDQVCITLRTKRDMLPVASFIVSTIVSSATLVITLLVLLK